MNHTQEFQKHPRSFSGEYLREAFFGASNAPSQRLTGVRTFATGGYTVVRSFKAEIEYMLVMDHGPLGYLSIAAHGHADALSVWLHVNGQPVLVDAGTYLYHSDAAWRDHFRSTTAHNTLSIAGRSSSEISDPFNWSKMAEVSVLRSRNDPLDWVIEAEHDGYLGRFGVYHRRRVEGSENGVLTITDVLRGEGGSHTVEVGFLFHQDLALREHDGSWIVSHDDRNILCIDYQGSLAGKLQNGNLQGPRGWYSAAFGQIQATNRLVFDGELTVNQPCRFVLTVL